MLTIKPVSLVTKSNYDTYVNSVDCNKKSDYVNLDSGVQKVFAKDLLLPRTSFKGAQTSTLFDLYNWFVRADGCAPLKSFLKIKAEPKQIDELFATILKDENAGHSFIWDLVKNPRKCSENHSLIKEAWNNNYNEYMNAYGKFLNKFYNEADSVETLLKFRPDWREDVLLKKFESINHHNNFELGKIPDELNHGKLDRIISYLKEHMQYGFKSRTEIPSINIEGTNLNFKYFTDGKSYKNVFGVFTDENKFVIKMADANKKNLNEPNSLGVLSLIDNYLTLNNCRNSIPIRYYNHNKNVSIYEYADFLPPEHKITFQSEINDRMPDFKNLGMVYSDTIGQNNVFVLNSKRPQVDEYGFMMYGRQNYNRNFELISVDNDHVSYSNNLMPIVPNLNKSLSSEIQKMF